MPGVEYPGTGLGQAQKCAGVKPVNGIPILPLLIIWLLMTMHMVKKYWDNPECIGQKKINDGIHSKK